MKRDGIRELREHSYKIGSDPDLAQASGGNTSWKNGKVIWVKGSGKRLKDAFNEDIFACISYGALTRSETLDCMDFSRFTTNNIAPSIEANFHILLSDRFVTHLHSLGSIAIGISNKSNSDLNFGMNLSFVPYARPGSDLAKAISEIENSPERILVLQNHGIIFLGRECSDIEKEISKFEGLVRNFFDQIPESETFPSWIEIITSGVMTPDEAVFLGRRPFVKSENSCVDSVAVNSKGELIYPNDFSKDRIELADFYVRVAKLVERRTQINYLSENEVHEILGWDKEQIRITMAK